MFEEILVMINVVTYHMTRTVPQAISLENHKKKGPV